MTLVPHAEAGFKGYSDYMRKYPVPMTRHDILCLRATYGSAADLSTEEIPREIVVSKQDLQYHQIHKNEKRAIYERATLFILEQELKLRSETK